MGFFDRAREEMRKGFAEGFMEGLNEMSDDDPFKKEVNNVIKSTEAVIDIYIEHIIRPSSREEYIGPKGITDIIGGMYGNTAIRTERKVKYTPAKTKWKKDKLILTKNGFQIFESKKFFSYDDLNYVIVYDYLDKNEKNIGPLVEIKYKNSYYTKFRTPQAYKVRKLLNKKIQDKYSSKGYKNKEISNRDKNNKQNESKKIKSQETSNNYEQKSFSAADELMKFGELYKQGLITEEEFTAMKKKLLEL